MIIITLDCGIWNPANAWTVICLAGSWRKIRLWPPRAPAFWKPVLVPEWWNVPLRTAFFGNGSFSVWAPTESVRLGYSEIAGIWEDGERFYLFFKDHLSLVLQKSGLGRRMPENFRNFLEREYGRPVERIK